MVAMHLVFLWNMRDRILRGDPDFTAFYAAGTLLRSGRGFQIYDPDAQFTVQQQFTSDSDLRSGPLRYIHPPFEALWFAAFSLVPYRTAFVLWGIANLAILIAAALLLRRTALSSTPIQDWDVVLALLAFFPVFANFFQGQDAILLLLVVVLALRALKAKADFVAGCWLALGLFRFQLMIPLVLVLLLWGRRRLGLGFVAGAAALTLLSAGITGWHTLIEYPRYLWQWRSLPGFGRTPASLLPSLFGLVTGWKNLARIHAFLELLVLVLSAGLVVLAARMKNLARDPGLLNLSFACAIVVSLLVGYNTSTYDLSLLAVPVAVVAGEAAERFDTRASRSLLVPVVPLLISPLWFAIGMYWHHFNLIAIVLLAWLFGMRKELSRRAQNEGVAQPVSHLA